MRAAASSLVIAIWLCLSAAIPAAARQKKESAHGVGSQGVISFVTTVPTSPQPQRQWTWTDRNGMERSRSDLDRILQQHELWWPPSLNHSDATNKWLASHPTLGVQADLSNSDLEQAYLKGAFLDRAILNHTLLEAANLRDAHLEEAQLKRCSCSSADLSGADLIGADLSDAQLSQADLSGARLVDTNLSGAFLFEVDLSGAYMHGAQLGELRSNPRLFLRWK